MKALNLVKLSKSPKIENEKIFYGILQQKCQLKEGLTSSPNVKTKSGLRTKYLLGKEPDELKSPPLIL